MGRIASSAFFCVFRHKVFEERKCRCSYLSSIGSRPAVAPGTESEAGSPVTVPAGPLLGSARAQLSRASPGLHACCQQGPLGSLWPRLSPLALACGVSPLTGPGFLCCVYMCSVYLWELRRETKGGFIFLQKAFSFSFCQKSGPTRCPKAGLQSSSSYA